MSNIKYQISNQYQTCPNASGGRVSKFQIWILIIGLVFGIFNLKLPTAHAGIITSVSSSLGLSSGLVGHWTFDGKNVNGANAYDVSGSANHGTIAGAVPTGGKIGQAMKFNGTSNYVEVANNSSIQFNGQSFSVAFWMKADILSCSQTMRLVQKDNLNTGADFPWGISDFCGSIYFYIRDTTTTRTVQSVPSIIKVGKFHHVVVTFNPSGYMKTYVDGAQSGTPLDVSGFTFDSSSGTGVMRFGELSYTPGDYFNGTLDDVRVYNRVLSASEIQRLYNMGGGVKTNKTSLTHTNVFKNDPNAVAVWRMEPGGLTLDSKGTNTLTNVKGVTESENYKEGLASADFNDASNQSLYITDANLSSGFPFKTGDTNKKISATFWINIDAYDPSHSQFILSKWGPGGYNKQSFALFLNMADSQKITFALGYNGGASSEVVCTLNSAFTLDRWYHVGFTYDDSSKTCRLRVWDDSANTYFGPDVVAIATNNINVEDALFSIGALDNWGGSGTSYFDGMLDEVVVFNDILTESEIDKIRQGIYGRDITVGKTTSTGSLSDGLVGHWTFDGKDITDKIYDISGNSNNGYFLGGATSSAKTIGKIGQALKFDGEDDSVLIPYNANLDFSGQDKITVTAWVKQTKVAPIDENSLPIVTHLNDESGSAAANFYLDNYGSTHGVCISHVPNNTPNVCDLGGYFTYGQWYFVAVTYNGSQKIFYRNGVVSATYNESGTIAVGNDGGTGVSVGGGYYTFPGLIDDVRIYNRALTADEIKRLYQMGR